MKVYVVDCEYWDEYEVNGNSCIIAVASSRDAAVVCILDDLERFLGRRCTNDDLMLVGLKDDECLPYIVQPGERAFDELQKRNLDVYWRISSYEVKH